MTSKEKENIQREEKEIIFTYLFHIVYVKIDNFCDFLFTLLLKRNLL